MSDVTRCPTLDDLRCFLLGRVADREAEQIEEHISACQSCLNVLKDLQADDALLAAMRAQPRAAAHPDAALVEGLMERLAGRGSKSDVGSNPAGPAGFILLDEVGRGGMGIVYRARETAFDREVAVKLLLDTYSPDSGAARRFLDEARITGQLQHPGIPAVYQVGALADGRPFLAMKLIKGRTLDALLKAGAAVDTLAVFAAISQAVGYAHAHSVIHRDLKPANVMVGAFGEVQVMDWGLAKVLAASPEHERPESDPEATTAATWIRTERDVETPFTQYGSMVGTPAYMAPEQAAGELERVSPRADVFGLGAILCTLLTGKPPYEGRNAEDVRLAAVRGQTAAALARLDSCEVDPEVISLCKRCLAFDPADRPATAEAVAAEVAALRQAADERVRQAERDRLAAEVQANEQAKRRRAVQWAAVAVAAVLLLGVAGTGIGFYRADAARRNAEAAERDAQQKRRVAEGAETREGEQRKKAESEAAMANAVKEFLQRDVLELADPATQREGTALKYDADVRLRDVVLRAAERIEGRFKDRPLLEAEIRFTLGYTLLGMGRPDLAAKQYERVLEVRREQLGTDHRDTLMSMENLACSYSALERHEEALNLYKETLALWTAKLGPDHPATFASMVNLANSYSELGRHDEALTLAERALVLHKAKHGRVHPETLGSMHNLAVIYADLGRHAEALKLFQETLGLQYGKLGPDHPDTLLTVSGVASSYADLGRHAEALELYVKMLPVMKTKLGPAHPDTLSNMWDIADLLIKLERGAEAVPIIDECLTRAAGSPVNPRMVPALMDLRLRHFQNASDPTGCRATAEMWEKLDRRDAVSLFQAACFRAVAAAIHKESPESDAPRLAKEDADRAVVWLAKAVAAGIKNRADIEQNKDLRCLHDREDFQKLLDSLPLAPAQSSK